MTGRNPQMATNYPLAASGTREPERRPRPIPKIVKDACLLMIYGDPEDEDAAAVDLISAAKAVGVRPATLRRYLTRPQVIAFLRVERRAFREAICAGNEGALKRVRDKSPNGMAVIGSVRALEQIGEEEAHQGQHRQALPGLIVQINVPMAPAAGPMVNVAPSRHDDEHSEPAFRPSLDRNIGG